MWKGRQMLTSGLVKTKYSLLLYYSLLIQPERRETTHTTEFKGPTSNFIMWNITASWVIYLFNFAWLPLIFKFLVCRYNWAEETILEALGMAKEASLQIKTCNLQCWKIYVQSTKRGLSSTGIPSRALQGTLYTLQERNRGYITSFGYLLYNSLT